VKAQLHFPFISGEIMEIPHGGNFTFGQMIEFIRGCDSRKVAWAVAERKYKVKHNIHPVVRNYLLGKFPPITKKITNSHLRRYFKRVYGKRCKINGLDVTFPPEVGKGEIMSEIVNIIHINRGHSLLEETFNQWYW
jgi:hypothetical protein